MANPRQRRKARSSSYRPVSHSKHAKRNLKKTPTIRGPKALQEAWDKRKTVKQNYARLGLVHSLNPAAPGGSETKLEPASDQGEMSVDSPPGGSSSSSSSIPVPAGYGRILRDEAGNVIGIELADDEDVNSLDVEETMEDLEAEVEESVMDRWAGNLGPKNVIGAGERSIGLLEELESIAVKKHVDSNTLAAPHSSMGPNFRHPAAGEIAYLSRLVSKHGEDVEAMARDRKLNPDQRTAGQLRRALRNAGYPCGK